MPVFRIIFTMAFVFLADVNGEKGPCKQYAFGCCPHTKWDYTEEMCVGCKNGSYWINCSKTCPYPAFGHQCRQTCHCNQEFCDFINGCIENVTWNQEQQSTESKKNFDFKSTPNIMFIMLMVLLSVFGVILMAYIAVLVIENHIKINGDLEHRNQS
ncbi:uncharacterized protein LOC111101508 [Crassostrea virginica]|nr:angiopoietin-1 receptor-like isoform X2 [Crassostrea virginica]